MESVSIGDDNGVPYAATWSENDVEFVVWDAAAGAERCLVNPGFRAWRVWCANAAGRPLVVAAGAGLGVFDAWTGACLRTIVSEPAWHVRCLACGMIGGRAVAVTPAGTSAQAEAELSAIWRRALARRFPAPVDLALKQARFEAETAVGRWGRVDDL